MIVSKHVHKVADRLKDVDHLHFLLESLMMALKVFVVNAQFIMKARVNFHQYQLTPAHLVLKVNF